jgi:hypothetical protein
MKSRAHLATLTRVMQSTVVGCATFAITKLEHRNGIVCYEVSITDRTYNSTSSTVILDTVSFERAQDMFDEFVTVERNRRFGDDRAALLSEQEAMHVYVLTAEIDRDNDPEKKLWAGITSVHATQQGALDKFKEFLDTNGILTEVADWDVFQTRDTDNYIGADPDPEDVDGTEIHWTIDKVEVL